MLPPNIGGKKHSRPKPALNSPNSGENSPKPEAPEVPVPPPTHAAPTGYRALYNKMKSTTRSACPSPATDGQGTSSDAKCAKTTPILSEAPEDEGQESASSEEPCIASPSISMTKVATANSAKTASVLTGALEDKGQGPSSSEKPTIATSIISKPKTALTPIGFADTAEVDETIFSRPHRVTFSPESDPETSRMATLRASLVRTFDPYFAYPRPIPLYRIRDGYDAVREYAAKVDPKSTWGNHARDPWRPKPPRHRRRDPGPYSRILPSETPLYSIYKERGIFRPAGVRTTPQAISLPPKPGTRIPFKLERIPLVDPYYADRDQGPSSQARPANLGFRPSSVDLAGGIADALIEKLSDENWEVRDGALDEISEIIAHETDTQIDLGKLPPALVARLKDPNRNVAANSFLVCRNLANALGSKCKDYLSILLPNMLSGLSAERISVRAIVMACMNSWAANAGTEEFFQDKFIANALRRNNAHVRIHLFNWLTMKLPPIKTYNKDNLTACIPYLYACLQDTNAKVRRSARRAVLPFMIQLGYQNMTDLATLLEHDSQVVVQEHLENAIADLPGMPPVATQTSRIELPLRKCSVACTAIYTEDKGVNKAYDSGFSSRNNSPVVSQFKFHLARKGRLRIPRWRKLPVEIKKSPTSMKNVDELVGRNLPRNILKQNRRRCERHYIISRWEFTTPSEEWVEQLKGLMFFSGVHTSLMELLFSEVREDHIRALNILTQELDICVDTTMYNYDMILKWMTLRFFDADLDFLKKLLEYGSKSMCALQSHGYELGFMEATSYVPFLLMKIGHPRDEIRRAVKTILRQMHATAHPIRVFRFLMYGICVEDPRQIEGCLDEMSYMISQYFIGIRHPLEMHPSTLRQIAAHITHPDNGVRNAALNCLVKIYFVIGHQAILLIGTMTTAAQKLLEARIKKASNTRDKGTYLNAPRLSEPVRYTLPISASIPAVLADLDEDEAHEGAEIPIGPSDSSPSGFGYNTITGAPRNDVRLYEEFIPLDQLPLVDQGEAVETQPYYLFETDRPPRPFEWPTLTESLGFIAVLAFAIYSAQSMNDVYYSFFPRKP